MTQHRSFKKLVRSRMAKTGESYTAARAQLLAGPEPGPAPVLATSDTRIRARTGRGWEEWFDLLDAEGLADRPHREIARWVAQLLGIVPLAWAAQAVTTSYERARGGRAVGQHEDGFRVSASRTVAVPAGELFEALVSDPGRWFGDGLRERGTTPPRIARYDRGETRVAVHVDAKDGGRATVTVEQSRLPDAGTAARARVLWRERLIQLKALLEKERSGA